MIVIWSIGLVPGFGISYSGAIIVIHYCYSLSLFTIVIHYRFSDLRYIGFVVLRMNAN